jgi:threonine dehydrogenase-like Zn-dependent dehydrogenase
MMAALFVEPGKIRLEERPIPEPAPTDALIRVTHDDLRHRHSHTQG